MKQKSKGPETDPHGTLHSTSLYSELNSLRSIVHVIFSTSPISVKLVFYIEVFKLLKSRKTDFSFFSHPIIGWRRKRCLLIGCFMEEEIIKTFNLNFL